MKLALAFLICATSVSADMVTPTRTLRPGSLISAADITLKAGENLGAYDQLLDVLGQEARIALYAGRPIPFDGIGPPALIERNQIVSLHFQAVGLNISTEGRALERGGVGDRVRIMNLSSRSILFGFVQTDGSIKVNP